ncbi:unnamed protein product [Blepharisma stoltei]|uniref:VPS9 domain-containing protein n=1 Tax=Blepharisma stoltei TaxID=1481888 RepID=A0AAU9JFA3_9CILI|nr:unnamed protein product [Blepharisma stoltei]
MGQKQSKLPCSYSDIDFLFQMKKQNQIKFFSQIQGFSEMSSEWIPYIRDRLSQYNPYIWRDELLRFVNTWNAHQDVRSKISIAWLFYMRSTQPKPKKQVTRTQLRDHTGECLTFTMLVDDNPYKNLVYEQLMKDESNALYHMIRRFGTALQMEFTNYDPTNAFNELKDSVKQDAVQNAELITNYIKSFISILTDSLDKFYLNLDQHIDIEARELIATHAVVSSEILEILTKIYLEAYKADEDDYYENLQRLHNSRLNSLSLDNSLRLNNGEGYLEAFENLVGISCSKSLKDMLDEVSHYSNSIKSAIDNFNPDKSVLLETDKFIEICILVICKASAPNLPTRVRIAETFLHSFFRNQEMEYVLNTLQGALKLLQTCIP